MNNDLSRRDRLAGFESLGRLYGIPLPGKTRLCTSSRDGTRDKGSARVLGESEGLCRRNDTAGRTADTEREREMLRRGVAGVLCLILARPYMFSGVSFNSAYSKLVAKQ